MESIKITSLTNYIPNQNLDNFAIPISYIINKNNYCNIPSYLYKNKNVMLSDDKINELIDLVNINKSSKTNRTTKKTKEIKNNTSRKKNKY